MVDFVASLLAPQPPILGEQEFFLAPQYWGVGGQIDPDRSKASDLCVHGSRLGGVGGGAAKTIDRVPH
jgi:hypothetical protein